LVLRKGKMSDGDSETFLDPPKKPQRGNCVVWSVFVFVVVVIIATISNFVVNGVSGRPLVELNIKIPLGPSSSSKFGALTIDPETNRLFICATGNNSLTVVDLNSNTQIANIPVHQPKGVVYTKVNDVAKLWVTNAAGFLIVLDALQFEQIDSFDLGAVNAESTQWDPVNSLIYVAYGNGVNGSIAIIDAANNERVRDANSAPLEGHPASFHVSEDGSLIYVNAPLFPGGAAVLVIESTLRAGTGLFTVWSLPPGESGNFAMLAMESQEVLILPTQTPRLLVMSTVDGHIINSQSVVGSSGGAFYLTENERLFVTGGAGSLEVFQGNGNGDSWNSKGTFTTGWFASSGLLYAPNEDSSTLYVPVPSNSTLGYGASVYVFNVNP